MPCSRANIIINECKLAKKIITPSLQCNMASLEGVVRPIHLGNAINWTISTIKRCLKKHVSARGTPRARGPGHVPHRPHG